MSFKRWAYGASRSIRNSPRVAPGLCESDFTTRADKSPLTRDSYIHGGAWRDPKITHLTFIPTINHLINSGRISPNSVAGFASIDYRLSAHPDHPQDPANTPAASLRDARHPDHIRDVQSAIGFLKEEYGMGEDYVLIGHSAGATLAFQLFMDPALDPSIPLPSGIIGVSGIYDLVAVDDRHGGNYAGFITSAFGSDKKTWNAASPVNYSNFKRDWPASRVTLLAWSHQDTLIDEPEIDAMAAKLIKDRISVSVTKELTGEHDQVWEEGHQLARLTLLALRQLQDSD